MRALWDIATLRGRFFVLACLIVIPFLRYLFQTRYPLWRWEAILAVAVLALPCLALAVAARREWIFYPVTVGCIVVTGTLPLQRTLAPIWTPGPVWIGLGLALILGSLAYGMRKKFVPVVVAFTLAALAVDVGELVQFHLARPRQMSAAVPQPAPSHVLYLILDEHIGPGGLPRDIPECRQAAAAIEKTFARYNFRLYRNAFSNYAMTFDSVPSILNRDLPKRARYYLNDDTRDWRWGVHSFRRNGLFAEFRSRGYAVDVYQYGSIDYARNAAVQRAVAYRDDLGLVGEAPGDWQEKFQWIVGNYQQTDWLAARVAGFFPFRFRARMTGPLSVGAVWPEGLAGDVVEAKRNTLFFVHLLSPHAPYVYTSGGKIRPLDEWFDDGVSDPTSDYQEYLDKYRRYAGQVEYLHQQLDWLFRFLAQKGLLERMLVVVHGDHGSRIRWMPDEAADAREAKFGDDLDPDEFDYAAEPEQQDLLNRFSALLAVHYPGAKAPVTIDTKASVLQLLAEALDGRGSHPLPGANSVYLFDSSGRTREIRLLDYWR